MTFFLRAIASLALIVPAAVAAEPAKTTKSKTQMVPAAPAIVASESAARIAQLVVASGDNQGLPWAVVDKTNAALFLFDATGKPLAAVPVLIGIAPGDEASPGVGNKKLSDLGPAEKTTPAGRFLAKFGLPVGGERVLWVDYATSVALHPIPKDVGVKEKRRARMLSPEADDNRITFGCINVPKAFYGGLLRPMFRKKGGYVYVLPDTKSVDEVFPRLQAEAAMGSTAGL
jgi:hypothetical protein